MPSSSLTPWFYYRNYIVLGEGYISWSCMTKINLDSCFLVPVTPKYPPWYYILSRHQPENIKKISDHQSRVQFSVRNVTVRLIRPENGSSRLLLYICEYVPVETWVHTLPQKCTFLSFFSGVVGLLHVSSSSFRHMKYLAHSAASLQLRTIVSALHVTNSVYPKRHGRPTVHLYASPSY